MQNSMERKLMSSVSSAHRDTINSGLQHMMNNPMEEFNMNNGYLLEILQMIDEWRVTKSYGIAGNTECPDYFKKLHIILSVILSLVSPKVPLGIAMKWRRELKIIKVRMRGIFIKNTYTQQTLYNEEEGEKIEELMDLKLDEFIRKLDEVGMLTKKQRNPALAMGDIE